MLNSDLRIATRDSPLALAQTYLCTELLRKQYPHMGVQIVTSKTIGDVLDKNPINNFGETGIFVKELRTLLQKNKADIAVHSYKDVPVGQIGFFKLGVLPRGSVRDILVVSPQKINCSSEICLQSLPKDLVIGTCSPRRKMQILQKRRDFQVNPIRGNIQTRLLNMTQRECDAVMLSEVALHRLKIISQADNIIAFSPEEMVPAAGQGAILVECISERAKELSFLQQIDHAQTQFSTDIERRFLKEFEVGCSQPFGIYVENESDNLLKVFFFYGPKEDTFHKENFFIKKEDVEKSLIHHIERIKKVCNQKGIHVP